MGKRLSRVLLVLVCLYGDVAIAQSANAAPGSADTRLAALERQVADDQKTSEVLDRIAAEVERMNERHRAHSTVDYLGPEMFDEAFRATQQLTLDEKRNSDAA